MSKQLLTKREEEAYRLVHQDFYGLSRQDAADKMKIGISALNRLLRNVQVKAPQLSPILTKQQYEVQVLITEKGLTHSQVAERLGIKTRIVDSIVQQLKKKGVYLERPKRIQHYEPFMDKEIVRKF